MKTALGCLLLLAALPLAAQEMQVEGTMADGTAVVIDYNPNEQVVGYNTQGQDFITQVNPTVSPYTIIVNGQDVTTTGQWGPFTITSPPVDVGAPMTIPYTMYQALPEAAPVGVPEPGVWALFALGGVYLLLRNYRRPA